LSDADKSPERIEQDMAETRDSLTEKVSLLENQVLGNIQSVTSGVTEAVDAVKDAVSAAPGAVSDTVKQTVEAVKESVRSINVTGCIRDNPAASLGTSALAGFLVGFLFGGGRSRAASPTMPFTGQPAAAASGFRMPGMVEELLGVVGREVKQMAEMALSSATAAMKENIRTACPTSCRRRFTASRTRLRRTRTEATRPGFTARTTRPAVDPEDVKCGDGWPSFSSPSVDCAWGTGGSARPITRTPSHRRPGPPRLRAASCWWAV